MIARTDRASGVAGGGFVAGTVGGLALGIVGVLSMGTAGPQLAAALAAPPAAAVATAAPSIQFAAHAVGTVARATELLARPGGGAAIGAVSAGTTLRIGGRVRVPGGLGTRDVLWVGVGDAGGQRHGFLVADDVVIAAGDPPVLDLSNVPAEALLSPGRAVHQGGVADAPSAPQPAAASAGDGGVSAVSGGSALAGAAAAGASLASAVTAGGSAGGRVDLPWLPDTVSRWSDLFVAAGARHGVDPELLAIVTLVESGGNPKAVSPSGASGLMQIMPATGAGIAQERGLSGHATSRLFEPEYNVDFGAYYLAQQLRSFGQAGDPDWQTSVELAAAAYNGGPGSVQRLQRGGSLPAESQRYRQWVGGMWRERHGGTTATLGRWLAAGGQVLVDRARQEATTG